MNPVMPDISVLLMILEGCDQLFPSEELEILPVFPTAMYFPL